jgi:hypothetical protein
MLFSKVTISALISAVALAQNATDEGPELRKMSHIFRMLESQLGDGAARITQYSTKDITKMLQNYGCHCFPRDSRAVGGAGKAQDDYDQVCLVLARCHKCIELDYGNDLSASWDADIGKYKFESNADGSIDCSVNAEEHKRDLCECDAAFAVSMGALWDDNTYDFGLWLGKKNTAATLDYDAECQPNQQQKIPDSCCGAYPDRMPFDSLGNRDCCDIEDNTGKVVGGSLFSSTTHDCCMDGSVIKVGDDTCN